MSFKNNETRVLGAGGSSWNKASGKTSSGPSIGVRISMVVGFALVGLFAVSGVFIYGDWKLDQAERAAENARAVFEQSKIVKAQVRQMQRREKDYFLLRHDEKYAELYDKHAVAVEDGLKALTNQELTTEMGDIVAKVSLAIADHRALFSGLVEKHETLGLNENVGLKGELRSLVHTVEDRLRVGGHDNLMVTMLMMRRHEKDYMLRGASKYIDRMAKRHEEFKVQLASTAIPSSDAYELYGLAQAYQDKFNAWSELNESVMSDTESLGAILTGLEDDIAELAAQARAHNAIASTLAARVNGQIGVAMIITITLSIFLAMGIGLYVVRMFRQQMPA